MVKSWITRRVLPWEGILVLPLYIVSFSASIRGAELFVPSGGPVSTHLQRTGLGLEIFFLMDFQRNHQGKIQLPQMCHAYVRACHLQYLFLRSAKRNRQLKGMVHFFPLNVKGVHDDDPSCKRLHSIKLREMYSVPVPKSFGDFKHLTPLLNIQKWFHVVFWCGFFF